MSEEGDLTVGDGRGEEGNTSMVMMYIHKLMKVNHYAELGKEGRGRHELGNTSMDMMRIHKLIKANHCAEHRKVGREREWGGNWGRVQRVL